MALNILHLSGYGVRVKTNNLKKRSEITIVDGRDTLKSRQEIYSFSPRKIPYDTIIIDGHSGYISLQAFHWLSKNNIPVFILDFDGTIISSILPPTPIKTDTKLAQIQASLNKEKQIQIAQSLIQAKIQRNIQVLNWIAQKYDITEQLKRAKTEQLNLFKAKTVNQIRTIEGRVALRYWQAIQTIIPECFDFQGRTTGSHNTNASDPINLALNYGYGVLEGECRKAINTVGLEPSIGFLHNYSSYQTKQSLVYDLQEPFRWIVDVTVLRAVELGVLDLKDFYFLGNDYRYHVDLEAKRRFLRLLKDEFNSGIKYKGDTQKWDTVILRKTQELARYLSRKIDTIDFTDPALRLDRTDSQEIRNRIKILSQKQARTIGIGKSTLHYLRKNASNNRTFKVYSKIAKKLCQ